MVCQETEDYLQLKRLMPAAREAARRLSDDFVRQNRRRQSLVSGATEVSVKFPSAPGIHLPQPSGFSLSRKLRAPDDAPSSSPAQTLRRTPVETIAGPEDERASSPNAAAELVTEPPLPAVDTGEPPAGEDVPLLFEHFMVIGPSDAVGLERAREIRVETTASRRLSKRLSNMLRRSFTSPGGGSAPPTPASVQPGGAVGAQAEDGSSAIIYRYPEEAAPPPPEVADFCLPLGSRLEYIRPEDEEAKAEEIFYGLNTGSGEHLSRCFIFMLEDKSGGAGAASGGSGEELGVDASRLYGVCVAHPRLLRVRLEEEGGPEGERDGFYSFESQVCYAFVTRFPFFEFFFTAINSMIMAEKLERMERRNSSLLSGSLGGSSGGEEEDLFAHYRYVPTSLIEAVLQRVKHLPPPRFNSDLSIEFIRGVPAVHLLRPRPTLDFPEHMQHAVNWALPTLVRRYLPAPP